MLFSEDTVWETPDDVSRLNENIFTVGIQWKLKKAGAQNETSNSKKNDRNMKRQSEKQRHGWQTDEKDTEIRRSAQAAIRKSNKSKKKKRSRSQQHEDTRKLETSHFETKSSTDITGPVQRESTCVRKVDKCAAKKCMTAAVDVANCDAATAYKKDTSSATRNQTKLDKVNARKHCNTVTVTSLSDTKRGIKRPAPSEMSEQTSEPSMKQKKKKRSKAKRFESAADNQVSLKKKRTDPEVSVLDSRPSKQFDLVRLRSVLLKSGNHQQSAGDQNAQLLTNGQQKIFSNIKKTVAEPVNLGTTTKESSSKTEQKNWDEDPNQLKHTKVRKTEQNIVEKTQSKTSSANSLKRRMVNRLASARFRYINEQLYSSTGGEAADMFANDKVAFHVYHAGFQSQVEKWPTNPVDKMIEYIQNCGNLVSVADFGCGDAKIARSLTNAVHSFDFIALNDHVTVCDMAHVPLRNASVDIAVFCLSLMGTNLVDYLCEASRVLRPGGVLLIAEVVSRFEKMGSFIRKLQKLGFSLQNKVMENKMFVWLEFTKTGSPPEDDVLPAIKLLPCVYKKR